MIPECNHHEGGNRALLVLIDELRALLGPAQQEANVPSVTTWPVLAIVGTPRSGSTLILQVLAASGSFAYPTNLLARFAYSPYIGARLQQMLFDESLDEYGDFRDIRSCVNYNSNLGKSRGALATNEFHHFFRFFFPYHFPQFLRDTDLSTVNLKGIQQGLASLEYAFGKPFVTKAMFIQYNIAEFYHHISRCIFLHVRRDPVFVMQSILESRERYNGARSSWWSVKPREYEWLLGQDVYHQIAGQVFYTDRAIERGLQVVPPDKKLEVKYEMLCKSPAGVYERVAALYKKHGFIAPPTCDRVAPVECRNALRLHGSDLEALRLAYDDFVGERLVFPE